MSGIKSIGAVLGALALVGIVVVGGYLGGWWLREDAVNRRSEINNDSYARQTALSEQVINDYRTITDIDVQLSTASEEQEAPLRAQRRAVLDRLCNDYQQMTDTVTISDTIIAYAERECP